jgi:hypothetical protein
MGLLQYTSGEMFSSTELIRKSKMIFDKLNNQEIEKAIILRDGKPSFMLLDFNVYEELVSEYLALKEEVECKSKIDKQTSTAKKERIETPKIEKESDTKDAYFNEINDDDLQKALEKIEQLDMVENKTENINIEKTEALKEFWD